MKFQHIFLMTTAFLAASAAHAVLEFKVNGEMAEPKIIRDGKKTYVEIPVVPGKITGVAVEPVKPAQDNKDPLARAEEALSLRVTVDTNVDATFNIGTDKLAGRGIPQMATLQQAFPLLSFGDKGILERLGVNVEQLKLTQARTVLSGAHKPTTLSVQQWQVTDARKIKMGPVTVLDIPVATTEAAEAEADDLLAAPSKTLGQLIEEGRQARETVLPPASLKAYAGEWRGDNHFLLRVAGAAQIFLSVGDIFHTAEEIAASLAEVRLTLGLDGGETSSAPAAAANGAADARSVTSEAEDSDGESDASSHPGAVDESTAGDEEASDVVTRPSVAAPQPTHAELYADGTVNPDAVGVPVTASSAAPRSETPQSTTSVDAEDEEEEEGAGDDAVSVSSVPSPRGGETGTSAVVAVSSREVTPVSSPRGAPSQPAGVDVVVDPAVVEVPAVVEGEPAPVVASEPVVVDVPAEPAPQPAASDAPVEASVVEVPAVVEGEPAPVVASEPAAVDVPAEPAPQPAASDAPAEASVVEVPVVVEDTPAPVVAASEPAASSSSAPSTPAKSTDVTSSSTPGSVTSTPGSSEKKRFHRLTEEQVAALSEEDRAEYAEKLARHERHKARRAEKAAGAAASSASE